MGQIPLESEELEDYLRQAENQSRTTKRHKRNQSMEDQRNFNEKLIQDETVKKPKASLRRRKISGLVSEKEMDRREGERILREKKKKLKEEYERKLREEERKLRKELHRKEAERWAKEMNEWENERLEMMSKIQKESEKRLKETEEKTTLTKEQKESIRKEKERLKKEKERAKRKKERQLKEEQHMAAASLLLSMTKSCLVDQKRLREKEQEEAKIKEEAEKRLREKEEEEKIQKEKEEKERVQKEKEEKERIKKEEEEKRLREKEEKERIKKEEAEKRLREKEEEEKRLREKEEEEKRIKEKEEQERIEKEEKEEQIQEEEDKKLTEEVDKKWKEMEMHLNEEQKRKLNEEVKKTVKEELPKRLEEDSKKRAKKNDMLNYDDYLRNYKKIQIKLKTEVRLRYLKKEEEKPTYEEEDSLNAMNPQSEKLKSELQKIFEAENGYTGKVSSVTKLFKKKLFSDSFLNSIDKNFFEITSELNSPLDSYQPQKSELKFDIEEGSSSSVALNVLKKYNCKPNEICIQIFADQTYCGCGILHKWTTQEEATLRDSTPALLGTLINQGYINPPDSYNDYMMDYINNKLSTSDGYLIRGELLSIDLNPLPENIPCFRPYFMFNSMPSLSEKECNFDEAGAASWILKCRKICCGETENFEDARKFASAFYKKIIKENPLNKKECKNALKILLFSTHYEVSNTEDKTEIVQGIINDCLKEKPKYLKQAEENYKKTITETVKKWVL
ncbi:MAG: DUF4670 domain-containing protein, partial [archaeon]|nr:DUF4670 domain-containing protein [archaeon]